MDIEWRIIPDFVMYEINNHGQIYSHYKKRVLEPGSGQVNLKSGDETRQFNVAALVLISFGQPRPKPGYSPNYKDKNRSNNHLTNLEWAPTNTEKYQEKRGVHLQEQEIHFLRRLYYKRNMSVRSIAHLLCLATKTVKEILKDENWKYIKPKGY